MLVPSPLASVHQQKFVKLGFGSDHFRSKPPQYPPWSPTTTSNHFEANPFGSAVHLPVPSSVVQLVVPTETQPARDRTQKLPFNFERRPTTQKPTPRQPLWQPLQAPDGQTNGLVSHCYLSSHTWDSFDQPRTFQSIATPILPTALLGPSAPTLGLGHCRSHHSKVSSDQPSLPATHLYLV